MSAVLERRVPPRVARAGSVLLAAAAGLLTLRYVLVSWAGRIPVDARFPYTNLIMSDFRDAVWLPGRMLGAGGDPYDEPSFLALFPHTQGFSPYTPSHLLLTAWAWPLPWPVATLVWSAVTGVALAAMGAWTGWAAARLLHGGAPVGRTVALGAASAGVIAVWFWRPTTIAHGLGQPSALWGPVAAVAAATTVIAPGLAPWARTTLTAATFAKPQAGIALTVTLVAARRWRDLLWALVVTAVLSLAVGGWIAGTGVAGWVLGLPAAVGGRHSRYDQNHTDGIPWIDLPATVYRYGLPELLTPVLVVVALAGGIWAGRRLHRTGLPALGAFAATTGGVLVGPHCSYDLLLLFPVMVLAAAEQLRTPAAGAARVAAITAMVTLVAAGLLPLAGSGGWRPEGGQAVLTALAFVALLVAAAAHRHERSAA
ncbi:glycosyltransferase family 87 protein [Pseudonocardia phyllosphaerae]|uniref:glycosyltransferase family 87 protein n=1 Tax=Pseudonocardia phyllosphaerae TaxID=3390502 RepID=UPI00397D4A72